MKNNNDIIHIDIKNYGIMILKKILYYIIQVIKIY
jgi:hypothetical protein